MNANTGTDTDFACFDDFDPSFRTVTGIDVAKQEAYHRLRTFTVVPDGDGNPDPDRSGDDWGFDVVTLLGGGYTDAQIANIGPMLASYIQKSPRIDTADVTLTKTSQPGAPLALDIAVSCMTALGPFSFVVPIGGTVSATLEAAS